MTEPAIGTPAPPTRLRLFAATGVELEYMIVDRGTLDVRPLAGRLLAEAAGREGSATCRRGPIEWSNELTAHVIELKTAEPAPSLEALDEEFAANVRAIDAILARFDARLLPTAAHPWMDPHRETVLWQSENSEIYDCYDRIFDCRGHGWANLQSMHLNLPFAGDEEFGRLHAAIRLVLPLLPALAASSPILDGRLASCRDARLDVYRHNQERIPEITGSVVPEEAYSEAEYQTRIFAPMMQAIRPHDPDGILEPEFLNSRGAIARFDRGSIEIRVLDVQECPAADMAIAALVVSVLRYLVGETWSTTSEQRTLPTADLARVLAATIRDADHAVVDCPALVRQFGLSEARVSAGELWQALHAAVAPGASASDAAHLKRAASLLSAGSLATRIVRSLSGEGPAPGPEALRRLYGTLADCLAANRPFLP